MQSSLRRLVRPIRFGKNLVSPQGRSYNYLANEHVKRLTEWNRVEGKKVIAYTTELISARGRPYEMITVGYCEQQPVNALGQRRVSDGYLELVLPFSTNVTLRDAMIRSDFSSIRYGKLFELLDSLAADVCYRHLGFSNLSENDNHNKYLVTASVDGAKASRSIDPSKDLTLKAYLTYVGTSSMECTIDMIQGDERKVGNTHFIMAARMTTGGKATVYGLNLPLDDVEAWEKFERGKQRVTARRVRALSSLDRSPPTAEEVAVMHSLFLESNQVKVQKQAIIEAYLNTSITNGPSPGADPAGLTRSTNANDDENNMDNNLSAALFLEIQQKFKARRNWKWMKHLTFRNTCYMHPQERNIHGKIFGGYLMCEAFELAWVSALCFFDGGTPSFKFVDDISFIHPVPCGAILEFNAAMIYAQDLHVVVQVDVFHLDPNTSYRSKTNELNYVFHAPKHMTKAKEIMPSTYNEFVLYLEGRRILHRVLKE